MNDRSQLDGSGKQARKYYRVWRPEGVALARFCLSSTRFEKKRVFRRAEINHSYYYQRIK